MKLLEKLKKRQYRRNFEIRYSYLTDDEKEVMQLLLLRPRTSCQLREKGYANPDTIIQHIANKGFNIFVREYMSGEREYKLGEENPWK